MFQRAEPTRRATRAPDSSERCAPTIDARMRPRRSFPASMSCCDRGGADLPSIAAGWGARSGRARMKQGRDGQVEAIGDSAKDAQARVAHPALDLRDECPVDVGIQREAFLAQPELRPPLPDAGGQRSPGRLVAALLHHAKL